MRAVFVGGCERSGTTLLGSILGGHARCIATPESHFKIDPLIKGTLKDGDLLDTSVRKAALSDTQFRLWGLSPSNMDERRLEDARTVEQLMFEIARCYGRAVGRDEPEVWVDHTPSNVKYAHRLHRAFPGAKFIHVIRDGRAVAASIRKVRFGPNSVKACADHWMGRVAAGVALEKSLLGDAVIRVHYESLVTEAATTVRGVCRFLGLDYEEGMIDGSGYRPVRFGRRVNPLVGRPPSPDRLNAWQTDLTSREIEIFEAWTGDLLPSLGYQLMFAYQARDPSWIEKLRMDVEELGCRVVNSTRYRLRRRWDAARTRER